MILIIGDEILDIDERLTTVGQCHESDFRNTAQVTPIVEVERDSRPGGAAAVAAMVTALDGHVTLLGNSRCHRQRTHKTRVRLDGRLLYRIDENVTESFAADVVRLIANIAVEPSVVLIASYGKGAVDRIVVEACLARNWRVVANPHHSDDPAIYADVWAVKCNADEDACQRYSGGGGLCCVTRGAHGLTIYDRGQSRHMPARADEFFDATGCGDQCLAAIGWQLSLGNDWQSACEWGNLVAGLKCPKPGTTPVTLAEVQSNVRNEALVTA